MARVGSADGFDGGGGVAVPRGSPGRSLCFDPRRSLSQDSISRSSPRGGCGPGGAAAGGWGGRSGAGAGACTGLGWAKKRAVVVFWGAARPGGRVFVVPAAEGVS